MERWYIVLFFLHSSTISITTNRYNIVNIPSVSNTNVQKGENEEGIGWLCGINSKCELS